MPNGLHTGLIPIKEKPTTDPLHQGLIPVKKKSEEDFLKTYREYATSQGLNLDPYAEEHYYNYKSLWEEKGGFYPDETGHLPSKYKKEGHPDLFVDGVDTRFENPLHRGLIPTQEHLFPKDKEGDCGERAAMSILSIYGQPEELEIADSAGTTPQKITNALKDRGINAVSRDNIEFGQLRPRSIAYYPEEDHYVAIESIDERGVKVNDSSEDAPRWIPREEFEKKWKGWAIETEQLDDPLHMGLKRGKVTAGVEEAGGLHAGLVRDTREWETGITRMPPTTEAGKLLERYKPKLDWRAMFIPQVFKDKSSIKAMEDILAHRPEVVDEYFKESAKLLGQHVEYVAKAVMETPLRYAYGFVKGKTFGAPELVMKLAGKELPEPVSTAGMIAEQIGSLFGLWSAIAWMNRLGPFAKLDRLKPSSKVGLLAKRMISSGLKIGTYSIISEHGGNTLQENMIRRGISGTTGAGIGAFFGMTGSIATTSMKPYNQLTAFIMRLGLNEMVTGLPAYRRWQAGDAPAAQAIYEAGLGLMFSLGNNPLKMEAEFNRAIKKHYKIKALTRDQLVKKIEGFGQWEKVPSDIKWAYIMKATDGKLKPNYQNVNSTDYIFKDQLRMKNRGTYNKMKFVEGVRVGIEKEMTTRLLKVKELQRIKIKNQESMDKAGEVIEKYLGIEYKKIPIAYRFNDPDLIESEGHWDMGAKFSYGMAHEIPDYNGEYIVHIVATPRMMKNQKWIKDTLVHEITHQLPKWNKAYEKMEAEWRKAGSPERKHLFPHPRGFLTAVRKVVSDLGLDKQETNLAQEMVTGKEVGVVKRLARHVGLVYKSKSGKEVRTNLNRFLKTYFNITEKDLKTLTKAQIEEARQQMKQMTPGPKGRPIIPKTRAIVLPDFAEWTRQGGNPFDWLQSARIPIKPIYDVMKPAYENFIQAKNIQMQRINEIYGGRVKKGSKVDVALAKYADGRIKLSAVPKEYWDIAIAREKFYTEYADMLLEKGLIDPKRVFKKDGTRKRYYHRILDSFIRQKFFKDDFAMEDIWLPGEMPLAGPLRKRMGAWGYKYSAIESDMTYIYAMEKYLNLADANRAGIAMAGQLKGMRKSMANVYLRSMRGQPTKVDRDIKESVENVMHGIGDIMTHVGLKQQGQKLKDWRGPAYPVSRIASPIARLYYWRYVGLAMDTATKNAFQWHHGLARYPKTMAKGMYMQHTPEGKKLIEQSGIMKESIQRGGHFIEEAGATKNLAKFEEASYFLWTAFDKNNRGSVGLAAYYDAINKGMSHPRALKAMWAGSHETQYGYTKADGLLMDMANPFSRFILFKKWPLAKVEMMRQWIRDGQGDALFNLALTEYLMYRGAQSVGIDLTNYFGSIWQLATRGIEKPTQMIPFISDITDISKMFLAKGAEQRKAKERVRRAWQGGGNRWIGKAVDVWRAWQDDWEVRDSDRGLIYKTTPKEQLLGLVTKPLEKTKRYQETREMLDIAESIKDARRKIMVELLHGDPDKAAMLQLDMMNKYGEEYQERFGKKLEVITAKDVLRFLQEQQIPVTERIRKRMPGKGIPVPKGAEYPVGEAPPSLLRGIRGY